MAKKQSKRKPSEFCEPMIDLAADIEAVSALVEELTDRKLRLKEKYAREELPFLIIQFGRQLVMEGIREGYSGYKGNMALTIEKLGGICANLSDPILQKQLLIISRFQSYFPDDFDREEARDFIRSARLYWGEEGVDEIEEMSRDPAGETWEEQKELIKAAVQRGWVDAES